MPIIWEESRPRSSRRLLVGDLVQLAELPVAGEPRRLGLEVGRRIARQPRRLVGLGLRHHGVEVVVDEQAPHVLVRVVADELLDVDLRGSGARRLRGRARRSRSRRRRRLRAQAGSRSSRRNLPQRRLRPGSARVRRRGPPRDPHPRRRHGARADRGDAPRARGDGRRVRVGPARGRRGRDGANRRQSASAGDARVDPRERGRAQGPDHDADRHRLPLGERRAPPRARTSTRACGPARRTPASAHATRRSTSSSSARTRRTSTRASSSSPGARRTGADRDPRPAPAEADRDEVRHLDQADQPRGLRADHPLRLRVRARSTAAAPSTASRRRTS